MNLNWRPLRVAGALVLLIPAFTFAQAPAAQAVVVTATGTDAAICNQEVSVTVGVVVQRLEGGDCLIAFTQPSTLSSWIAPSNLFSISYLAVGGGGGGATGYDNGGGGGGGGGMMLTGTYNISPGNDYSVNIGTGGAGGANARANNPGANGSATTFGDITATGGQGGYGSRTAPGGARVGGAAQTGTSLSGRGGNGGSGGGGGGGGGGATGAGGTGIVGGAGGSGGSGFNSDISGNTTSFASGGAGGSAGAASSGTSGASNTGRGGNAGSGGNASSGGGGAGGSGVLYIRYSTAPVVFNSLSIQGGTTVARYRTGANLEASIQAAGRVTFFADGKRIPRCIDLATSGAGSTHVATCTWAPSRKGAMTISAAIKPTAPGLVSRTSATFSVVTRTTRR